MPFLICVKRNYNQGAKKEADRAYVGMHGVNLDRPKRNCEQIGKLVRALRKSNVTNLAQLEQLVEKKAAEDAFPFTKEDIRLVTDWVSKLSQGEMFLSLESGVAENDGEKEGTLGDLVTGPEPAWYEGEDHTTLEFLNALTEHFDENVRIMCGITGKVERDLLKAFLTKDILMELKLKVLPENGTEITPEPKCRQWCHRVSSCPPGKKTGCYARYDAVKKMPPYGDEELYRMLQPMEKALYTRLLHSGYLDAALMHEDFHDVYANKLYPHPSDGMKASESLRSPDCARETMNFDFSDATLAKALGKDKGQLSGYRKKYPQWKAALFQAFSNEFQK